MELLLVFIVVADVSLVEILPLWSQQLNLYLHQMTTFLYLSSPHFIWPMLSLKSSLFSNPSLIFTLTGAFPNVSHPTNPQNGLCSRFFMSEGSSRTGPCERIFFFFLNGQVNVSFIIPNPKVY